MYKARKQIVSKLTGVPKLEGEPIEWKIERILEHGEAISDGAPEIYTEKSEGVKSAYNIRTDRWEIATEAMDAVHRSKEAKRDSKPTEKEAKVVELKKDGKAESKNGTTEK